MKIPAAAIALDGKVDARTIYNRKRHLMALQRKISRARNRKLVGSEAAVLVSGLSPETDLLWEAACPPGAGNRRRHVDQRFRGRRTAPGADAQAAHHRSARLRSGRYATPAESTYAPERRPRITNARHLIVQKSAAYEVSDL